MKKNLLTLAVGVCSLSSSFATTKPNDLANLNWQAEIPKVIYPDQQLVDLYEKTWEIAADRVRVGPEGLPSSPYLDENCYEDQIWIWDACYMVMFSKYAPNAFPGKETLNNLYIPIHEKTATPLRIHWLDNPPLFAWTEYQNYIFSGDKERINYVLRDKKYLQRHFDFFNTLEKGYVNPAISPNKTLRDVVKDDKGSIRGFTWTGWSSGMDNTPRGRDAGGYEKVLWVDAIAQQALSALYIARLYEDNNDKSQAKAWRQRYNALKKQINEQYWDDRDHFYYDIAVENGEPCRIKTPASFWPMLAEIPSKKQAAQMVEYLKQEKYMGGKYPWPSLSRDDKSYNHETGDYWKGGIWLPMVYMGTKALEKYGYYDLADAYAENVVRQQLRTYHQVVPHTIWECYSPSADRPSTEHGRTARPDFCGWSALGPISLFIENVMGFRSVDANEKIVTWSLKKKNGTHGIRNLHIGANKVAILYNAESKQIEVSATEPFTLKVNDKNFRIKAGESKINYAI